MQSTIQHCTERSVGPHSPTVDANDRHTSGHASASTALSLHALKEQSGWCQPQACTSPWGNVPNPSPRTTHWRATDGTSSTTTLKLVYGALSAKIPYRIFAKRTETLTNRLLASIDANNGLRQSQNKSLPSTKVIGKSCLLTHNLV